MLTSASHLWPDMTKVADAFPTALIDRTAMHRRGALWHAQRPHRSLIKLPFTLTLTLVPERQMVAAVAARLAALAALVAALAGEVAEVSRARGYAEVWLGHE
jgi:hypothetical protein